MKMTMSTACTGPASRASYHQLDQVVTAIGSREQDIGDQQAIGGGRVVNRKVGIEPDGDQIQRRKHQAPKRDDPA